MMCVHDEQVYANPSIDYFEGYQKVKLFLCSRDIKVGDMVSHVIGAITYILKVGSYSDMIALQGLNAFKVIGEISTDALAYVKEGDEFDDENCEWIDVPKYHTCISIKGPCGHYH